MLKYRKQKMKSMRWSTFDTVVTIIALLAGAVCLYPLVYVFSCSISQTSAVLAGKVYLWPVGFSGKAYQVILSDIAFWRSFCNSVGYVVAGTLLMLFTTVAMAYPLTRPDLKGRKFVTYFLLITMYFGGGLIPSFILISKLGLYNTPWALILPGYGTFNIILCRTYMASLPEELIDSALIDGADQIKTLIKVVLPLSKAVLAVIAIYTIVGVWNSWYGASIYTTRQEIQPLQLYLNKIMNQVNILNANGDLYKNMPQELKNELAVSALAANQIKYAAVMLVSFPVLVVYRDIENESFMGWSLMGGMPASNKSLVENRNQNVMVKVHPGLAMWRSVLAENLDNALRQLEYDVSGLFLDVTLCTYNLANSLVDNTTTMEGMQRLISHVRNIKGGMPIGGEGLNEITMQKLSLGQVHLFDYNLNGEPLERTGKCDLNQFLFGKLCRAIGYSGLGGRTEEELIRMRVSEEHGTMPTLTIRNAEEIENPNSATARLLKMAGE